MAVTISYGVNEISRGDLVGETVQHAITEWGDTLEAPSGVQPRVDGVAVQMDHILRDGNRLELVKVAGEKGCC